MKALALNDRVRLARALVQASMAEKTPAGADGEERGGGGRPATGGAAAEPTKLIHLTSPPPHRRRRLRQRPARGVLAVRREARRLRACTPRWSGGRRRRSAPGERRRHRGERRRPVIGVAVVTFEAKDARRRSTHSAAVATAVATLGDFVRPRRARASGSRPGAHRRWAPGSRSPGMAGSLLPTLDAAAPNLVCGGRTADPGRRAWRRRRVAATAAGWAPRRQL